MKFAVGYQEPENGERFSAITADYRNALAEVYFAWPGAASGRAAWDRSQGAVDWSAPERLEAELAAIRAQGLKLDLLLNANCYGERAVSTTLENEIASLLDHLDRRGLLPEIVTTTSPFVAEIVRRHVPDIERRASVNLRLDSTLAMSYLGALFDSFHLRRDLQRDLATVARVHAWCREHGKTLCLLANSGCLRNCPAQTFHDNLVAHDEGVAAQRNVADFQPHLCRGLFADPRNVVEFLRGSWIRPEDLARYEPYVPVVKLATRRHSHPRMVIGAYAAGRFDGNLADLTEPGFAQEFAPFILDNRRFPADWHTVAGACATDCTRCGRCEAVLRQVLVDPGAAETEAQAPS